MTNISDIRIISAFDERVRSNSISSQRGGAVNVSFFITSEFQKIFESEHSPQLTFISVMGFLETHFDVLPYVFEIRKSMQP